MNNSSNLTLPRKPSRPASGPCRLARYDRPGTMVGGTPVLRIAAPFTTDDRGFWAKLEGVNPGGMKDRPAMYMVERGRARIRDVKLGLMNDRQAEVLSGLDAGAVVIRMPQSSLRDGAKVAPQE